MPSLTKFCDRMRYWCTQGNLGYDQGNRWDIRYGGECDCSSLVIFCLQEAGFDTGSASYTGNMSSNLTARGWKRIPFTWSPQAGDILLNDANHVAAWLGDCLAQASIDENGDIAGGQPGDQTDRETNVRSLYDYPWDCILRYTGAQSSTPASDGTTGSGVTYQAHTLAHGWLEQVSRVDSTEDGYAGWQGSPIDAVKACKPNGVIRVQTHMMGGGWNGWTEFDGSLWGSNSSGDGFSGDYGIAIDAIRVEGCQCRVKLNSTWQGWMQDGRTPNGDDYCGVFGMPIVGVQMRA